MRRGVPRLPEFKNGDFGNDDFRKGYLKRVVISYDGEIIIDLIRPDKRLDKTGDWSECIRWEVVSSNIRIPKRHLKNSKYVGNGFICNILNNLGEAFDYALIEIVISDNVGQTSDVFCNRVLRYVVTYHDGMCDCECISDDRRLENVGDVFAVMGC